MGLFWCLFFFKQKTAYEMRISDWSSDVCSSDLAYFRALYDGWLGANSHKTGLKIIADYLLSYPIERGAIPMRAPETSSMADAIVESRGWIEQMIADAVDDPRK